VTKRLMNFGCYSQKSQRASFNCVSIRFATVPATSPFPNSLPIFTSQSTPTTETTRVICSSRHYKAYAITCRRGEGEAISCLSSQIDDRLMSR